MSFTLFIPFISCFGFASCFYLLDTVFNLLLRITIADDILQYMADILSFGEMQFQGF